MQSYKYIIAYNRPIVIVFVMYTKKKKEKTAVDDLFTFYIILPKSNLSRSFFG